jgi:DNA-binding transcriptional ArsR family regulator
MHRRSRRALRPYPTPRSRSGPYSVLASNSSTLERTIHSYRKASFYLLGLLVGREDSGEWTGWAACGWVRSTGPCDRLAWAPARANLGGMPSGAKVKRAASVEELKALAHPVRWRILRLCLDDSLTNQEIAGRLAMSPATTLRHVRALVDAGFLDAEPVRQGVRGSRERPYRATGRTWGLAAVDLDEPELVQQVDLAILGAHRAELRQAGPNAGRDLSRGTMRLRPESLDELKSRIERLLVEFGERDEPDGEPLSYLWSLVARQ